MAEKLFALGAKYGSQCVESVGDALPCAKTVSRHLSSMAAAARKKLSNELSAQPRVAVTSDLWTHEATNQPYITVTAHYIDAEWNLCAVILATRNIEGKKTAENIRTVIGAILGEFGADRPSNVYVTDNGSNMKKAFAQDQWLPCTGHNINLAVSHALDGKMDEEAPLIAYARHAEITQLVTTCKEIVTRVKRTQIQSKLETTLKQVYILSLNVKYIWYSNKIFSNLYLNCTAFCHLAPTCIYRLLCNISVPVFNMKS